MRVVVNGVLLDYYILFLIISLPMTVRMLLLAALPILLLAQNCYGGCFECDTTGNACTACYDGFQLTLLAACTLPTHQFCSLYVDANTCARCLPTYRLIANTCVRDYSGCIMNPTGQKCEKCSSELTLSVNACVGVLNCKNYAGKCLSCSSGFSLVKGICVAQPANCVYANPANGVCMQCRTGYTSSGYKCVSKLIFASNCQLQDDKGRCQICKDGYTNVDGSCYGKLEAETLGLSSKNNSPTLQDPSNITQTATSKDSQLKSSGETSALSNSADIQANQSSVGNSSRNIKSSLELIMSKLSIYCKSFSATNVCVQCYQSFYLVGGYCLPIDPYCKNFSSTDNICLECYKGYTPDTNTKKCLIAPIPIKDGNCQTFQDQDCLACFPSYHLKLGLCIPNNPLCKDSAPDGTCVSCYLGYLLTDGDCNVDPNSNPNIFDPFCIKINGTDCILCTNGYFVDLNGTCSALSLNCLSHDERGSCLECLAGFEMIQQNCIQSIDNCVMNSAEGCRECVKGYFIKKGLCFKLDVTCATYDQGGACVECIATYYLIKGSCIYPSLGFDPLCTNYRNSYCVSCQAGSFLSNYRCKPIDINCIKFDSLRFRCLQCANGLNPRGIACA